MLSWRLLLATGEDKYADLIERTLLNNVLASPRADGRAFYYTNTLHQRTPGPVPDEDQLSPRAESGLRAPWFEVSCCPTNVARTLASVGLYFATASDDGIQLHQYGDYDITTEIVGVAKAFSNVRSGYPFDGAISVLGDRGARRRRGRSLRIPEWADGATLDGDALPAGTVVTSHRARGEQVILTLPSCRPRKRIIHPHPHIDGVRGTIAMERGPLVLVLGPSTDCRAVRTSHRRRSTAPANFA